MLLSAHHRGLLLHRDELNGWLGNMNKYGGQGDRAFWLETFDGRRYTVDRVKLGGEPIVVPYNAVSVLGSIQPDKLAEVLEGADDGLTARFLWVWPDPVPPRRPKSSGLDCGAEDALRRLASLEMAAPSSPEGPAQPVILPLDPDAVDLFDEWRREHAAGEDDRAGVMASHCGKYPGFLLRLALILEHLWWCPTGTEPPRSVSKRAVAAAAALSDEYFMPMAERAFGDAALPQVDRNAVTLAKWLLKGRPTQIKARDLGRKARLPGLHEAAAVDAALSALVDAGLLRRLLPGQSSQRRRKDYEVNPELYERQP